MKETAMEYIALYRKYRPQTFDKIIGQEHITRTLVNQIQSGRTGHAYLFAGSRGTGKTSAAKIFARAVNCISPSNGSPCGTCAACTAMLDPANLDITEIDAASNNRVDEIRELREKVKYPPVNVKYKVYIIDEVHMLTESAFNALLKTLEEPPAHVIFILATTEAHKLPATILSRVMRFDFRLLSVPQLSALLAGVLTDSGKEFEDGALDVIAAAAEGSVRDALSIADICLSYSAARLTAHDVYDVLGAADSTRLFELADAVIGGAQSDIFTLIDELMMAGKSAAVLAKDMAAHFRNLLTVKTLGASADILHKPREVMQRLAEQADGADFDFLFEAAESFARLDSELRYSITPRILVEITCLRLTFGRNRTPPQESAAVDEPVPDIPAVPEPIKQESVKAEAQQPVQGHMPARKLWGRVITELRRKDYFALYAAAAEKTAVHTEKGVLVLRVGESEYDFFSQKENIGAIEGIVKTIAPDCGFRVERISRHASVIEEEIAKLQEYAGDKLTIKKVTQ